MHPYKVPTTLSELNATITSGFDCSLLIGKIIASDGSLHNNVSSATSAGKTASAMIAYIGNMNNGNEAYSTTYNHGLAIALTDVSNTSGDEGTNYFGTESAPVACMNYKRARPTNSSSWMLPNIYQWERILIACGSSATYISSVAEGGQYSFGYGNLRTYLTNCGATDFETADWPAEYYMVTWYKQADNALFTYDFASSKFIGDITGRARAVFAF